MHSDNDNNNWTNEAQMHLKAHFSMNGARRSQAIRSGAPDKRFWMINFKVTLLTCIHENVLYFIENGNKFFFIFEWKCFFSKMVMRQMERTASDVDVDAVVDLTDAEQ